MANSCQVDFYVLESAGQSAQGLACTLALKAWEQGHRVSVLVDNATEVSDMDALMWEAPAGRFLPHCAARSGQEAPVIIGTRDEVLTTASSTVINLTSSAIEDPERFQRLLEIVPANDEDRVASRTKFRAYRARGLQPSSHDIGVRK